jgi:2,3-bisphosphoglycerate-independent phosphoglycerate mutase
LVVNNGDIGQLKDEFVPPHNITGKKVEGNLPFLDGRKFIELQELSYELLKNHPINLKRISEGKNPANSLWFWGEGTKPQLEKFEDLYGVKGAMISAVDLLKGIGILAGMEVIEVEGATGNFDTNFKGKAQAALNTLLSGNDLVYVHMEAPDECGHHGDVKNKIYSIEQIDGVVEYIAEGLKKAGEDFAMLICPDHPTPVSTGKHEYDLVPYVIYRSNQEIDSGVSGYDEEQAERVGVVIDKGCGTCPLMSKLLGKA